MFSYLLESIPNLLHSSNLKMFNLLASNRLTSSSSTSGVLVTPLSLSTYRRRPYTIPTSYVCSISRNRGASGERYSESRLLYKTSPIGPSRFSPDSSDGQNGP